MTQYDSGFYWTSKGDVISPPAIGTGTSFEVSITDQQTELDSKLEFTEYVQLKSVRLKWKDAPEGAEVSVCILNDSDTVVSRLLHISKIEGSELKGIIYDVKDEDIDEGYKLCLKVANAEPKATFKVFGEVGLDRESTI